MARKPITLLVPEWSKPQWTAIAELLAGNSITLDLEAVESERLTERFGERVKDGAAPDVVMLPDNPRECNPALEFDALHTISNRLEEKGLVLVKRGRSEATAVIPLWACTWTLHATNIDSGVETLLLAAGRYRDPKLPVSPVWRTRLLFHEQNYRLPKKLGGIEFSIHFPGTLDLEILTDLDNPNRGTVRILGLRGALPAGALRFLVKLPWPGRLKLDPERDVFALQLREPDADGTNRGTIDFQTGVTALNLSVRVHAPFLEPVGMATIEMVIHERGRWDPLVGTLFVESGTVTLIGGLFNGLKILLLAASKNETETVETNCVAAWEPVEVQVLQYGTKPESQPDLERMRELFKSLSSSGARLASLIAAAVSIGDARSVFVTYVCVKTRTFQVRQRKNGEWQNEGQPYDVAEVTATQRVELPDRDAMLWWGRSEGPSRGEVAAACSRNVPRATCRCP